MAWVPAEEKLPAVVERMTEEREEPGTVRRTDIRSLVAAAHASLKSQVKKIDALNVYPVPDGDTGTNMLLTLQAVLKEVSDQTHQPREAVAKAVARAALMGARGNSGVILSQIVRGACEVLGKARTIDAETVAAALTGAKERAYSAMQKPVEGTMLSVIKDAAAAARAAVDAGEKDVGKVIGTVVREAHASVKRTPELLGVLREAGVVDAGGVGIAVILDGLHRSLRGEKVEEAVEEAGETPNIDYLVHSAEESWGYCTEFMVNYFSGDAEEFSNHIHEIGKSVLVIPSEELVKVHLHTQNPGEALSYAGSFGRLSGVKVDDMEAQMKARTAPSGEEESEARRGSVNLGVIAASRGAGSKKLFEDMGAMVIEGGQGANPSVEDFVRAVEWLGAERVILLPNNKNVVPTAERVGELVEAEIYVTPTTTIAGGLAVMVGFDPEGEPGEVAEEMCEIAAAIMCAEVTYADRDSVVEGREVKKGDVLGLLDGRLAVVEGGIEEAAFDLGRRMIESGSDIITLLHGEDFGEEDAGALAERLRMLDTEVEVEVRDGGQPIYPLQMVAE